MPMPWEFDLVDIPIPSDEELRELIEGGKRIAKLARARRSVAAGLDRADQERRVSLRPGEGSCQAPRLWSTSVASRNSDASVFVANVVGAAISRPSGVR